MNPRILLVEDDPTSRAFLQAATESLPAHVDSAVTVAEALALAARHDYALWLIDANLPDGSGSGLLARLRAQAPSVPAIAHTASPFGQEGLKLIGDALAAQRLQVVGSAALTAEDATAQEASRKLMALSPQAVVLFVPGSQAAAMMATAAGLKRHPAFFGLSIVGDDEALRRIGPQARGLALTQVTPNPWRETDRQMEIYRQQARAAGVEIGYASLAGWIDAQVLIEALRRCGGQLQRPRLTATLRVMQLFVAGMAVDFSRQDLGGSRFVDLVQLSESGRYLG